MRKRIAVLVAQIDETTQKRFLTEFLKEAYRLDYDVCIFSMYQKYQETELRNVGDSNIFELVNYTLFDAIIILLDTLLTPGLTTKLQDKIKTVFTGPVLTIDKESPYFEAIMMDHYTPVRKLVDHLIEVHGYTDIAFLGGKKGHPHSVQRLKAFEDSMEAHNLPILEEWVYHGNYWYDSAEEFVDKLLTNPEHLPRAIACANDCMAIGVASRLTEKGYRVPEDVAVIGYDSLEDGKNSPKPLTSANIPADECGHYTMQCLDAILNGKERPEFKPVAPLFIGGSCGCHYEIEMVPKTLRPVWKTRQSARSVFSDFNHILEDLLSQSDMKEFLQTISNYAYQIKPFHSFDICMNESFLNPEYNIGEKAIRQGYSEQMYRAMRISGEQDGEVILDFENSFNVHEMIPELDKERDYPTAYIFNPLYFDDRCFGYTVLNYGKEVSLYEEKFRVWMRNIMQGMEAFYRQQYLQALVNQIKADQIRDSLTGFYNYDGFIKQSVPLLKKMEETGRRVSILSIDIKGIRAVNEIYGRDYGLKAIKALARFIQQTLLEEELCCRMYSDEFMIVFLEDEGGTRAEEIISQVSSKVKEYRLIPNSDYVMELHTVSIQGSPNETRGLEALINYAISMKNHKKASDHKGENAMEEELKEEIRRNQLVTHILNENLLTYYYQPIVSAVDGNIYAYEALMRYEEEKISPSQIIKAASYLKRLPDIERATLLNVTADVERNLEEFGETKVFMNSLPGIRLSEEDDKEFMARLRRNKGKFVIEFTEESELDDEHLALFKAKYEELGNEIAVDDYGSGYSNVNNLLRYMPRYVKIDRQLIMEIDNNPQKQHFVSSIVQFAHKNEIYALAEGVETREELRACIRLGIDLIQGFYTGKPKREPAIRIAEDIQNEIRRFHRQSMDWQLKYMI